MMEYLMFAEGLAVQALTADNEMTHKPNLALNAEIESSGRAVTPQPQLHGTPK
jgi:hypothetical protein